MNEAIHDILNLFILFESDHDSNEDTIITIQMRTLLKCIILQWGLYLSNCYSDNDEYWFFQFPEISTLIL